MSRKNKKHAERLAARAEPANESGFADSTQQKTASSSSVTELPWIATKTAFFLGGAILFGGAYWLLSNRKQIFGSGGKKSSKKKPSAEQVAAGDFYAEEPSPSHESLSH